MDVNLLAEILSVLLYNLVSISMTATPLKTSPGYFKVSLFILSCMM